MASPYPLRNMYIGTQKAATRLNANCTGIGKLEPLKYELAGYWSRRIYSEHRIIYSVHDDIVTVYVLSMRYHYTKK